MRRRALVWRTRIIPAYAGSTYPIRSFRPVDWDHPRIRGEHGTIWSAMKPVTGSSPHTRGALVAPYRRHGRRRIIPAYAGSTMAAYRLDLMTQDHPRIRGEHVAQIPGKIVKAGSSPHTRGAREDHGGRRQMRRIIPAYAGSTSGAPILLTSLEDHPRIRGEHGWPAHHIKSTMGSSPHTRGARPGDRRRPGRRRIIPAYAGSTQGLQGDVDGPGDHPRIRGEHREICRQCRP